MPLDLALMRKRVFENEKARRTISKNYDVGDAGHTADTFIDAVIHSFNQTPCDRPLEQRFTNSEVFRAAVRTIGSNNRSWVVFLRNEPRIRDLLDDYDPVACKKLAADNLTPLLKGTSSSKDAAAILKWGQLLSEGPNYYSFIQRIAQAIQHESKRRHGLLLPVTHLMLCVAGYLGSNPAKKWRGEPDPEIAWPAQRKLPGMGYTLASEFLRNLRWNGFKPDRHVRRLFHRWMPSRVKAKKDEVQRLAALIGKKNKDLLKFFAYSLTGIEVTPKDQTCSYTDNLVWLLGTSVEKKGKESDILYIGKFLDYKCVERLIRDNAGQVLMTQYEDGAALAQDVDGRARALGRILLGHDRRYSGTEWNAPGKIDLHVAHREGILSDRPEERVGGALVNLLLHLYTLSDSAGGMPDEEWKEEATKLIRRYSQLFMEPGKPLDREPSRVSSVSSKAFRLPNTQPSDEFVHHVLEIAHVTA